jgi:hypothetical protein
MEKLGKANACGFDARVRTMLAAIAFLAAWAVQPAFAVEPAGGASPPSAVATGGVTLRSVSVDFPDPGRTFPGDADAINNNCLACHSAGMVLTQPHLSRTEWQAEVDKMRLIYKAPIAGEDVPAIVNYLASLNGGN